MESKEEVLSVLGRAFQTDDTQPRIDRSEQLLRRASIRRSEPNNRWVGTNGKAQTSAGSGLSTVQYLSVLLIKMY